MSAPAKTAVKPERKPRVYRAHKPGAPPQELPLPAAPPPAPPSQPEGEEHVTKEKAPDTHNATPTRSQRGGGGSAGEGRNLGGIMTASSSVVLRLQLDEASLAEATPHNFEHEFLIYDPKLTLPGAYIENDNFRVLPQEIPPSTTTPASDEGQKEQPESEVPGGQAPTARKRGRPPGAEGARSQQHQTYPAVTPPVPPSATASVSYSNRCTTVLQELEKKSKDGDWPLNTGVACFWCCHTFEGPPVALPVRYRAPPPGARRGGPPEFHTIGCFCSISCAAAYNLESRDSHETVCDRHSMLCELSRLTRGNDRVRAAPMRTALAMFGGYMSIEEFRAAADEPVAFLENVPPMRSLTQQIEEVDENDVLGGYSFVPLDRGRAERGMEELALRRNKPLLGGKNTLDHALNLRFAPVAAST